MLFETAEAESDFPVVSSNTEAVIVPIIGPMIGLLKSSWQEPLRPSDGPLSRMKAVDGLGGVRAEKLRTYDPEDVGRRRRRVRRRTCRIRTIVL